MMLLINGSPKLKKSNSFFFLNKIDSYADMLYLYQDKFNKYDLNKYETIIFSFPLYVDGPSNKVIEFFEYINQNKICLKNKKIYVIVNCGFLEPYQNDTAVDILKDFCKKNEAKFMGSFKIGAGEIVGRIDRVKIYRIMCLGFIHKIKKFKKYILDSRYIELETTIHPMSKKLYIFLANISWNRKIRKNKGKL